MNQHDIDMRTLAHAARAVVNIARQDWTQLAEPPYDGQTQAVVEAWADDIAGALERLMGDEHDDE